MNEGTASSRIMIPTYWLFGFKALPNKRPLNKFIRENSAFCQALIIKFQLMKSLAIVTTAYVQY
jgi:hypothetical protein